MQTKWLPDAEHHLGSVDYNGNAHLWDLRYAAKPVSSNEAHSGKGLCMSWAGGRLLSGGSDCCIKATAVEL